MGWHSADGCYCCGTVLVLDWLTRTLSPSIDREVKSYNARLPSRPGGGIGPGSPAAVSHERSFRDIRQKLSANLACRSQIGGLETDARITKARHWRAFLRI